MKSRSKSGFTLVEILIVVVILGILAAIVIPQFSQASTEARTSSVQSNLQMVRSQIELYKIQHGDVWPATGVLLETALTTKTNYAGAAYTAAMETAGDASFGPYMQKWPTNAVTASDAITDKAGEPVVGTDEDDAVGWLYNTEDGLFYACDDFSH
jgi:general secretion pathway protein G